MVLSYRPYFLHQLNISRFVTVLGQLQRHAGQRYEPRDSWTKNETKRSLKQPFQFKNSSQKPTTTGKQHYLHKNLYKLHLYLKAIPEGEREGEVKGGTIIQQLNPTHIKIKGLTVKIISIS